MQRLLLTEVKCELQASEGSKQMLYHSLWELVTATQELVQFHISFFIYFFRFPHFWLRLECCWYQLIGVVRYCCDTQKMQAMFTSLLVVIWLDGRDASCKRELFGGLLEQTGCKILLIKNLQLYQS